MQSDTDKCKLLESVISPLKCTPPADWEKNEDHRFLVNSAILATNLVSCYRRYNVLCIAAYTCPGLSPDPLSFVNCPWCILCPSTILQFYVFTILCSFKHFRVLPLWEQISTGISWFPSSDFSLLHLTLNKLPILQARAFDPTDLFFGTSELFQHRCPSHARWDILGTDRQTSYLIQRLSQSLMYEKEIILNFLSHLNHSRK